MKDRKKIILTVSLIFATLLFALIVLKPKAQDRTQQEDDPPTPIQLGVMSEKQRRHSKLYRQPRAKKDLISKGGNVNFVYNLPWGAEAPIPTTFLQLLNERKCNSDAIIIGEVISKASQLTETNTFVFTDYEIGVQDILFKKQSIPIAPNTVITFTRRGGSVLLNNRIITVRDRLFIPLRVGRQYLLILKAVPETDSFMSLDSRSSFELNNNRAIPLTEEKLIFTEDYNLTTILNQLRSFPNCSI